MKKANVLIFNNRNKNKYEQKILKQINKSIKSKKISKKI